jgi:hypothetical protein
MGASYTEFRGDGFWARDSEVEFWLCLMVEQIDQIENPPEWLVAARNHWWIHGTEGFNGCVSADLDEFAAKEERRATLYSLSGKALARLQAQGEILSKAFLDGVCPQKNGAIWFGGTRTTVFSDYGQKWMALLAKAPQMDEAALPSGHWPLQTR